VPWLYPKPFVTPWKIEAEHIDHYQHVNNVAYVKQLEITAWAHANTLGLNIQQYQALNRGMVIRRHHINYLAAARLGDELACATWITACDEKLKLTRQFQFVRQGDKQTILTAKTDFVCIALSNGKPALMPKAFCDVYGPATIQNVAAL
jgi:acyl-CoA thioester hydrolase